MGVVVGWAKQLAAGNIFINAEIRRSRRISVVSSGSLTATSPAWCGRRAAGKLLRRYRRGLFQRQRRQFAVGNAAFGHQRSTARLSCCSIWATLSSGKWYRPGVGSLAGRGRHRSPFRPFHGNVHQHTSTCVVRGIARGARRRSGSGRCRAGTGAGAREFVQNALRQLRGDHSFFGNPAPVRRNMRPPLRLATCKIRLHPLPAQRRCRWTGR